MLDLAGFSIGQLPRISFGEGRLSDLPGHIAELGRRVLLVTGRTSFRETPHWQWLMEALRQEGIEFETFIVEGEPSPERVDGAVTAFRERGIEVVVGIGGGSVLDAAKAIAGLLPFGNSVLDHLEDVGRGIPYRGPALPLIAVPTTAGTGSEATKNAVLSVRGEGGYKKSFRHDTLVARLALVDPQLLAYAPPHLIASQGMDALTQLLESYVSVRANPFTDALAFSGLKAVAGGFVAAWQGGDEEEARQGRAAMAYGALISGITLAQVGLGSVHGLAQPLGSLFPVPHGVACGTTVAVATVVNLEALRVRAPQSPALRKYAEAGRLLARDPELDDVAAQTALVETLTRWTQRMEIPRLGAYGITASDIPWIVAGCRNNSMRTNPVVLDDEEVGEILRRRL